MNRKYGTYLLIALVIFLGGRPLVSLAQDRYAELQNFSKILNLVQQYYVEDVDTKKLVTGAIKGMLKELDPHTNFMAPEIFKDFESETSGEFGGIGIAQPTPLKTCAEHSAQTQHKMNELKPFVVSPSTPPGEPC